MDSIETSQTIEVYQTAGLQFIEVHCRKPSPFIGKLSDQQIIVLFS